MAIFKNISTRYEKTDSLSYTSTYPKTCMSLSCLAHIPERFIAFRGFNRHSALYMLSSSLLKLKHISGSSNDGLRFKNSLLWAGFNIDTEDELLLLDDLTKFYDCCKIIRRRRDPFV